jgi:hypothetical protein
MTLEIQFLAWDRHQKNVMRFKLVNGAPTPTPLDNLISNDN